MIFPIGFGLFLLKLILMTFADLLLKCLVVGSETTGRDVRERQNENVYKYIHF